MSRLKQLIHEIHRRSLWQVLAIYIVGSWLVLQVALQIHRQLGRPAACAIHQRIARILIPAFRDGADAVVG